MAANTPRAAVASQALYLKDCGPAFPALTADMVAKANRVVDDVNKQSDDLSGVTKGAITSTFLLILGGLIAVMVGGFFAIRSWVVSPLKGLSSVMDRLAKGDLQVRVEGEDRRDELGGMARAVQVFKDAGLEKLRLAAEADALRGQTEQERRAAEEAKARAAKEQA
jgi:methyl-accepting chemotaxis protein